MTVPFEVPARLLARYLAGDLVRNGALLREADNGRIVAHLQETAGLTRLLGTGLDPTSIVTGGVQIYQNEQIKVGLALVEGLQVANLALTGIGIGVSIAGFAIVCRKLDRIEAGLGEIADAVKRVTRQVDSIQDRQIRSDLAALRAELRRIDEAWSRTDAQSQWLIAADQLLTWEQRFLDHARSLKDDDMVDGPRAQMVDAFILAGGARISALLAAGEEDASEKAAHQFAREVRQLTGAIGAPLLLRQLLAREPAPLDSVARLKAIERLRPDAERRGIALREREAAAATAPFTIAALVSRGISGREWLERARAENDAPLICLLVGEASP